jgi:hypothetical protein
MIGRGADRFPQSDCSHLENAALDPAGEIGVRLYTPGDDDGVGVRCLGVAIDRHAAGCRSDRDDVHLGADGRTDARFGNSQTGEHLALPGARTTAMRAHRGDEKRLGADVAHRLRESVQNGCNVRDPPAAGGDRHARAV